MKFLFAVLAAMLLVPATASATCLNNQVVVRRNVFGQRVVVQRNNVQVVRNFVRRPVREVVVVRDFNAVVDFSRFVVVRRAPVFVNRTSVVRLGRNRIVSRQLDLRGRNVDVRIRRSIIR